MRVTMRVLDSLRRERVSCSTDTNVLTNGGLIAQLLETPGTESITRKLKDGHSIEYKREKEA